MALSILLLMAACGSGSTTYDDPAQCQAMEAGPERDECYAATAAELFRSDPQNAEQIIIDQVQDPKIRDFIWLTVTREVDPGSYRYCEKIQEAALAERCKVLVSRPHLHRALQQSGGEAPQQGGPPPNGGPPQGGGPPPGGGPPGGGPPGGAPMGGGPGMAPPTGGAPPPGAPIEGPAPTEAAPPEGTEASDQ